MTTPTPSLARRVVVLGVAVVGLVLLVVNGGVYLALRASLQDSVDDLLAERVDAVRFEQSQVPDPAELSAQLQARGLRTVLTAPDGRSFTSDPTSPVIGGVLPPGGDEGALADRTFALPDGTTAQVFARKSGVDTTLRRLLALQVAVSVAGLGIAALLLGRSSRRALQPVRDIAEAAGRTAAGERGARLHPDQPDTELGRMAVAYDRMLDALEEGARVAAVLEERGSTFETRWRQVLDAAQEAYVAVDAHGLVSDWNHQAEDLFGWTRAQVVGRPAHDLVPPEEQHRFRRALESVRLRRHSRRGPRFETTAVARDGQVFIAEATVWGVDRPDGQPATVHVFVRDVSLLRRTEQAAARLAAVIEGSADAISIQSLDGTMLTWNAAAERMLGWDAASVVGSHVSLLVPDDEMAAHEAMVRQVAHGEAVAAYDGQRRTRGGDAVPVSLRLAPVRDASGRVIAVSSIARDLTEQRFLSNTLDQTLVSLEAALSEATASEERTRQFLADAAHQLRTPIAGIQACAEALLRGVPPEAGDELLAAMVRETARSARLVTSLLQMARLDQGQVPVLADLDVVAVCADEIERTRVLAPHLDVALDVDGPVRAHGEPTGLKEALANLLDNARRHASTSVRVRVELADDLVRVLVTDDGPGLPPDRVERAFERFVSLDGRGGSGLGLPIARGVLRTMGGDLRYERGFLVVLPAARQQTDAPWAPAPAAR